MSKRIYLCLAHMSGKEQQFIQEAFDTNWVVPLGPNVNGFEADLEAFAGDNEILKQITDLALLANGMLKGKELSDFIARSAKVVEDAYLK